jgi:hypothetical protein
LRAELLYTPPDQALDHPAFECSIQKNIGVSGKLLYIGVVKKSWQLL